MGLFGMFTKKPAPQTPGPDGWTSVAGKIAGTFTVLLQKDPRMLASQYARVVLDKNWGVSVRTDQVPPDRVLGPDDVAFVFFQEDKPALAALVEELKGQPPFLQQAAIEQYAGKLMRALKKQVNEPA